jgi:ketosteroid isomerase-like protein
VPTREEIVKRSFDAFQRQDWELLESLWEPDGEVVGPDPWPEAGTMSGWPAILAQFKRLKESWAEDRVEIIEQSWAGERLCTRFTWSVRGEASGLESETEMWMVSEFRGDRFARVQYFSDGEALRAALEEEEGP